MSDLLNSIKQDLARSSTIRSWVTIAQTQADIYEAYLEVFDKEQALKVSTDIILSMFYQGQKPPEE